MRGAGGWSLNLFFNFDHAKSMTKHDFCAIYTNFWNAYELRDLRLAFWSKCLVWLCEGLLVAIFASCLRQDENEKKVGRTNYTTRRLNHKTQSRLAPVDRKDSTLASSDFLPVACINQIFLFVLRWLKIHCCIIGKRYESNLRDLISCSFRQITSL